MQIKPGETRCRTTCEIRQMQNQTYTDVEPKQVDIEIQHITTQGVVGLIKTATSSSPTQNQSPMQNYNI